MKSNTIKFVLVFSLVVAFSANELFAQTPESGEIGIFAGGAYYLGDLNKIPFVGSKLAFGAFFRHTFDSRFSARASINYGHLSADNTTGKSIFMENYQFNNAFYELNIQVEFNFIPYTPTSKKTKFTPYVFAGAGLMYYPSGTKMFPNIPFGVGLKYNVYKNFIFGANAGMRKTFSDDIDYGNRNDSPPSVTDPFLQKTYAGTKDWYSVFGVYLSYKIKYRIKCPAFD